jgi:hypothetical protein
MKYVRATLTILILTLCLNYIAHAQAKKEQGHVITNTFWAPTLITQLSNHHLRGGILNVTLMHTFGIATKKPFQNFFGMDNFPNVRLGLDIGITNRWSMGIGRSAPLDLYDLRTKYGLLRQKTSNSPPISISFEGDIALITQKDLRPMGNDISTLASLIISRKFNDLLSVQLTPMYAHFSYAMAGGKNDFLALGIAAEFHLNYRYAIIVEYNPLLVNRPTGTKNTFSLGANFRIGGHVFQVFLTSTKWHVEQYVITQNDDRFWMGDFRLGFNINRIFHF